MSKLTKTKKVSYIDNGNHFLINSPEDDVTWKNAHKNLKEIYRNIEPVNFNDTDEYAISSSYYNNNCVMDKINSNYCNNKSSLTSNKPFGISTSTTTILNTTAEHMSESINYKETPVTVTALSMNLNKEVHSQVITSSKSNPRSPILKCKESTSKANIQNQSSVIRNHIADLVINRSMSNSEASEKFNLKNNTIRNLKFRRQNNGTNYEKSGRPDSIDEISDFSIKKRYSTIKFNTQDELKRDLYDFVGYEVVASKKRKQENLISVENKLIGHSNNHNTNRVKNIQTRLASNHKGVSNRTIKRKVSYYYNKIISNEFLFSTK